MPNNKKVEPSPADKKTEPKGKSEPKAEIKETKGKAEVKETKPLIKKEEEQKTASKKAPAKVVVEEVVDDEDDEDDNESENESGSEEEDEKKQIKEKKAKKSFTELATDFEKHSADIKTIEAEISEIEKNLKAKEKSKNDLERQRNKVYAQMGASHDAEVKKAMKEKPKRKGNKDGGFNKEQPVPPVLIKFLGLEDGVKMARPKIMSLLNDSFKSKGIKQGQTTTLDPATAKALGKEKGRVIEFTAFQSFLKEFYQEAFPEGTSNTVNLS
jgi:hypothetical protein